MDDEKCSECKNGLVFGEKSQCIYCELSQTTGNKSCPKCSKSVLRDKGSLYCELCKCFYHNTCNEFPLDDQYCTLLYEVPRNIKWFCDKCIWDTEKWISDYSVNDSSDSRTNIIDNSNLDKVQDILDQEKYAKSNKRNKQNLKRKNGRAKGSCKNSKVVNPLKTTTVGSKVTRIARNNIIKVEDHNDIEPNKEDGSNKNDNEETANEPIIKEEDIDYDSTFEADDLDYHPLESDSDWEIEGRKKNIRKDKLKKKESKKKKGKKFKCNQCPKGFMKEEVFKAHKLWHTGDKKPYKCDLCTECYAEKRSLDQHKMKHSGEYPFICNFCGIGKARIDLLKCHIKIKHSEEKPFTCPDCDFCSRTRQKLKKHIRLSHRVLEILKCTLCDYQTKNKSLLNYHMKDHTGENYFMCDECGHNLKSLASLKNHQLTHTGEKPFKCEVCEKSFRSRANLRVHMFVHTKEKRAFCPVCGYGFPTKDKLDIHLKTVHSDEKPFECETCGNKYKTKHNLKNHQSGKRGSCHPNKTIKQKIESLQKFKSSSESNMSDSNDSHLVSLQQANQQPPLLFYAGGNEKSMAQKIESLQKFKSCSESNMSDSNDSHLVSLQQANQQPPLLFYAGGNEKSMAPVYSNSHITATIHCPPPYLSVINYMDQ